MTYSKNIAVIGCGHWGKNLVRNFAELGALAAICDGDDKTASKMAETYNVQNLSWNDILQAEDIKAVVLATPAPAHFEMAKAVLLADKDVYVEKPITLKNEHAQELVELAQKQNKILMVGHLLQYHPAFIKLKNMVKENELGKLLYIYSNRLSFGKIRREENVLWSFAPHDVSMILSLAGEKPSSVNATGSAQTHPSIEDYVMTAMKFPSGLAAHINVSWLHPFKEQRLVVIGEKSMAVFDDQQGWDSKLMLYPHGINISNADDVPALNKADGQAVALEEGEPLKMECAHFLDCIQNRTPSRTDGEEGLSVLEVLNAAEASLKG